MCSEHDYREFLNESVASDAAHDISHIERVVHWARRFSQQEGADTCVVTCAAWLHDCVTVPKDSPLRSQASILAAKRARTFLTQKNKNLQFIERVCHAIEAHSYSAVIKPLTLEAQIVQDADRLDALGAVGMARCFMVGGALNRSLYCEVDPFCRERIADDQAFSVDHFYTKLFAIAETLHTRSAREEAELRVAVMKNFLRQLEREIVI